MSLVIKKWKVNSTPTAVTNTTENIVSIQGRQSGLIGFLLSLIGMDPSVKFEMNPNKISYTSSSWGGTKRIVVPMTKVATGYFGYTRPWKEALILGVALLPVFGLGLVVGPLYYFLNKRLEFGVRAVSGESFPLAFQRSVIEGQNIDEKAGQHILALIEQEINNSSAHYTKAA